MGALTLQLHVSGFKFQISHWLCHLGQVTNLPKLQFPYLENVDYITTSQSENGNKWAFTLFRIFHCHQISPRYKAKSLQGHPVPTTTFSTTHLPHHPPSRPPTFPTTLYSPFPVTPLQPQTWSPRCDKLLSHFLWALA